MQPTNTSSGGTPPEPTELQVSDEQPITAAESGEAVKQTTTSKKRAYRPSHKATLLGIGAIIIFLGINIAGLTWLLQQRDDAQEQLISGGVTLSGETLDRLGVNREPTGEATQLTVGPNSTFRGTVTVASDVSIGGNLQLNSDFVAQNAKLANLQAGDVQLEKLNVNADGTMSTLNLRKDLNVVGMTRLQGQAVFSQLVTINNSLNVAGNLAVGGTLTAQTFEAHNLTSGGRLTIGGHIITRGGAPGVSRGGAVGGAGTVSISGSDAAGTVAANVGVGGSPGLLASISFNRAYASTPRVVVAPVGRAVPDLYVNRTSTGFTISTGSALGPGGYAFDYIVMQ